MQAREGGVRPSDHISIEELYAFLDDALPANEAQRVQEELDACLPCARAMAEVEGEYRLQILEHLQGAQVPLPPPSRFVRETLVTLQARLQARAGAGQQARTLPAEVQAILQGHLPQSQETDAVAGERAAAPEGDGEDA